MRRKPDCGFDLYFVKHVLEFLILIYVLYKSGENLNSYGLWSYSHVLMCLSMGKWALCGNFYSYVDPMWLLHNIGTGCHVIAQVLFWVELPVQRRLCPIFVKSWAREYMTKWCGAGFHESSAGQQVINGPLGFGAS